MDLSSIAERYVKLVLALGKHDPAYVDAYYGPSEWNESPQEQPLEALLDVANELLQSLSQISDGDAGSIEFLRLKFLSKQLIAVRAHASRLISKKFLPFDEEASLLYDAEPSHVADEKFVQIVASLDSELPNDGQGKSLEERYGLWKHQFVIPPERVDAVFQCAIREAKRQTLLYIPLPEGENFSVEYVTKKPWGGYNWFKGNYFSLIQVNMDLPIYIDRAIDLAAHEGYPGHHVFNSLLEEKLYRKRGWVEFCVYPLFSPQSLIAEGTANFGIEMIFPNIADRILFEQEHLFPLAGIDPSLAPKYYHIEAAMKEMTFLGNEACRRLLDGQYTDEQTVKYLCTYSMSSVEGALKRIEFFKAYRSYIINYNVGLDMVREYVARQTHDPTTLSSEGASEKASPQAPSHDGGGAATAATAGDLVAKRWKIFEELLTTPRVPSLLL